jgi:hypothetical protein
LTESRSLESNINSLYHFVVKSCNGKLGYLAELNENTMITATGRNKNAKATIT